ncbi:MAG: aminotransferase class I/II-fold pyridoxal phosphate-dependent enzyme [Lacipirellulaceae bacterium]
MRNDGSTAADLAQRYGLTHQTVDLVGLLRLRATALPRQRAFTFLVDGESQRQHINYEQLDTRARAIAAYLQSQGLAGSRALLLFPSGLEFIAAFFGCLYAGVVAVPAYPPRRNRNMQRIQSIVGDAQPKIALTTEDVFRRIEPLLGELPDLASIDWKCTRDIQNGAADAWRDPQVSPETLAFLQYTSGSTGTPKGVMLSHGNLLHNTAIISTAFRPSYLSSAVTWLPLYHDMGLIGGIIQPIYFGRPTTVMTPTHFLQQPVRWLRTMSETGALISGGPNFAYELCVERVTEEEKDSLDLSQWELAFNGAEPVRAETIDRFSAAFARCGFRREAFYPCYGLAEATLMVAGGNKLVAPTIRSFDATRLNDGRAIAVEDNASGAVRMVGSGASLLEQEIVIADPETFAECLPGHVGEVWVSGPSVAQGYWRRPEASAETFQARLTDGRGPFLRTGDLGSIVDGELFLNGRLKDLIILRGVNHYPQDIELTSEKAHDDLRPAAGAAFAVGGEGAEKLVVVHEVVRKRDIDFAEVCAAVRRSLAIEHDVSPQAVVLIKPNSIPKTSSGKIQRHACREAYVAGELAVLAEGRQDGTVSVAARRRSTSDEALALADGEGVATSSSSEPHAARGVPASFSAGEVLDRVTRIVKAVGQDRAASVTLETDIAGLGLDSLERMEIVALLEKEFGGRFSEAAILAMETVGDVVRQVRVSLLGEGDDAGPRDVQDIPEADYVFAKSPEYRRLADTFRRTAEAGLKNPYFTRHEGMTNDTTVIGGRTYINFCSYSYLGMSGEEAVHKAARDAIDRFGTSTSASRVVSGEKTIHRELEQAIAEFVGAEDAIVLPSGHATNESVIGHLFGPGDLILHDALAHNSIIQGCKLSGAQRRPFPHNDWRACDELLARCRRDHRRVLVVIEGVYSMDGDFCDLPRFVEIKERHKVTLMIDEAHSVGTMGATGRGMCELQGVDPKRVDILMGTISKALGSGGGYIASTRELVEYLKYTTPGFVFSGGITPANTAAGLAALRLLESDPGRVARLHDNARLFLDRAKRAGFNTGPSGGTAIVPIITGNSLLALALSNEMFERGINVQPILHPAVDESAARLRFFITSSHTEAQIRRAVTTLSESWERVTRRVTPAASEAPPAPRVIHAIAAAAIGEPNRDRSSESATTLV